ncbi:hypothetical protein GDO81_003105 [Engystomops pustulosus]|uniref:Uncharacterized protein n=1 Tax=Engystomops pustulosus TaxID=76066 RepID=A0AAV6ZZB5_ENGPU|nr:hypothetical protein GDO81_003105 [Engystomops pustulosus]
MALAPQAACRARPAGVGAGHQTDTAGLPHPPHHRHHPPGSQAPSAFSAAPGACHQTSHHSPIFHETDRCAHG